VYSSIGSWWQSPANVRFTLRKRTSGISRRHVRFVPKPAVSNRSKTRVLDRRTEPTFIKDCINL